MKSNMATKKLSKVNIIAIVIVCVLTVAFAIFLPLYLKHNKANRKLYKEEKIKFTAFNKEIGAFTLEDLLALPEVKEIEFKAMYDTSSSDGVEKTYVGVELKAVLKALKIDLTYARHVSFFGGDGINKIYSVDDVLKDDNVYIAFKVEGVPFNVGIDALAYTKKAEDGGPFVVIRKADRFSQHRCKLLTEVKVE